MTPAVRREAEFRRDLAELLAKHRAEIDVGDDGRPFGMHSGVARVSLDAVYDADGETLAEYAEFEL